MINPHINSLKPTIQRLTEAGFTVNTMPLMNNFNVLYSISYNKVKLGYFGIKDGRLTYSMYTLMGKHLDALINAPRPWSILDEECLT